MSREQVEFENMSPEDIQNQMMHGGSMAGPAMMFVELNPAQADGSEWDTETIEELAMKWRELLFTGGFSVQVYSIEEKKILITVQKGWEAKGVRDFVVDQPEMTKASVDPRAPTSESPPTPKCASETSATS